MPKPTPASLAAALLHTTTTSIIPLTAAQVVHGSKLFGAAILSRSSLQPVIAETNNERESPLLHGEINCIQQFFKIPTADRPETKECVFFATHEPCSLCLSGITWSGFNEFYYMFTYEDSRDLFGIPCEFISARYFVFYHSIFADGIRAFIPFHSESYSCALLEAAGFCFALFASRPFLPLC